MQLVNFDHSLWASIFKIFPGEHAPGPPYGAPNGTGEVIKPYQFPKPCAAPDKSVSLIKLVAKSYSRGQSG